MKDSKFYKKKYLEYSNRYVIMTGGNHDLKLESVYNAFVYGGSYDIVISVLTKFNDVQNDRLNTLIECLNKKQLVPDNNQTNLLPIERLIIRNIIFNKLINADATSFKGYVDKNLKYISYFMKGNDIFLVEKQLEILKDCNDKSAIEQMIERLKEQMKILNNNYYEMITYLNEYNKERILGLFYIEDGFDNIFKTNEKDNIKKGILYTLNKLFSIDLTVDNYMYATEYIIRCLINVNNSHLFQQLEYHFFNVLINKIDYINLLPSFKCNEKYISELKTMKKALEEIENNGGCIFDFIFKSEVEYNTKTIYRLLFSSYIYSSTAVYILGTTMGRRRRLINMLSELTECITHIVNLIENSGENIGSIKWLINELKYHVATIDKFILHENEDYYDSSIFKSENVSNDKSNIEDYINKLKLCVPFNYRDAINYDHDINKLLKSIRIVDYNHGLLTKSYDDIKGEANEQINKTCDKLELEEIDNLYIIYEFEQNQEGELVITQNLFKDIESYKLYRDYYHDYYNQRPLISDDAAQDISDDQ